MPVSNLSSTVNKLKKYLWTYSKPVAPCQNDDSKKVLFFNGQYNDIELSFLPEDIRREILDNEAIQVSTMEKEYTYDDMNTSEVLSLVIPEDVEKVMSFETAGHIAHMNLRDSSEKYKYVIGQVILDKNKHIKTVVNKTSNISTVFRTFEMEVIAGENNMIAETKECGCKYKFDFSKVYWNSRLGMEHERLVDLFKPGDVIVDMFCGIGPFAIPAAKKGCIVYANDLNPSSYEYLLLNTKTNKTKLNAYNLDGGEFVRYCFNGGEVTFGNRLPRIDHVVMNLPASAITFLSNFVDINDNNLTSPHLPTIHCYGFAFGEKPEEDIVLQAEKVLGKRLINYKAFNVRSVSNNKHMMRLSFPLTIELSTTAKEEKKRKFDNIQ